MTSIRNAFLAGVCALAVGFGSMPAEAASSNRGDRAPAANTIAGVPYDQIQTVGRRGGGWRGGGWRGGGHRGWRGGGYRGARWGGGRHWGGGRYYGRGWGGRRYYYGHRHRNYGGYAAAGILGLAAGAAIAGNGYGYYDRPYYGGGYGYYDRPYRRGYYSRAYYGGQCKVLQTRRDYYGRRYTVARYRPC
ncbi:hypothetical protein [Methylopila turkensis]|uniref:Lectin-like protein BA14k n=1 Tax=Methylopila turkensis TaxID=1437816 RepID=A0A9W6JR30_9HYPH|nr:hypothetical protein [Methylopila turkensis]GLK80819.1 hypothetical protein GCM10008174_25600 [Methylopila turkensis]